MSGGTTFQSLSMVCAAPGIPDSTYKTPLSVSISIESEDVLDLLVENLLRIWPGQLWAENNGAAKPRISLTGICSSETTRPPSSF